MLYYIYALKYIHKTQLKHYQKIFVFNISRIKKTKLPFEFKFP